MVLDYSSSSIISVSQDLFSTLEFEDYVQFSEVFRKTRHKYEL